MVEKELDAMIVRRSRKGETDPDEKEALWMESVRRYDARRRKENRQTWREYHQGQAERLRSIVGHLIAFHEGKAAKLCGEEA
jgi:hypothetical protein